MFARRTIQFNGITHGQPSTSINGFLIDTFFAIARDQALKIMHTELREQSLSTVRAIWKATVLG